MIAYIKRAEQFADVIEVRLDCLPSDQIENFKFQISNLNFEKTLLATFRAPDQGGQRETSLYERRAFWRESQESFGIADLEEDVVEYGEKYSEKIVSFHDFEGVPGDLDQIFVRLAAMDADVIKLAAKVNDITEAVSIWNLMERAKADGKKIIPIAMGEAGKWTRILGPARGAYLTYAALDAGKETADGQLTAKDLIETYRVKELDQNTEVFGVIGDPVSQSLSPYMHNAAFAAAGVNAVFMHLLVKDLDAFIRRMVKAETREVVLNFGGFSVTMPHKQAIIPHLDAIDPTAAKIGAVNTIKIEDGKLAGYNTDAHGFITPLKARFGDIRDARVAVFGAGGASRACVYALQQEGTDVTVFARDPHKAKAFADEFGIKHHQLTTDNRQLTTDILVDATPLGMKGPLENESLFTADELSGVKFVYDLVTSAADTPIVRAAKTAGIPAIGGLEMLIAQGVKQFEIWTGEQARPDRMREILLTKMKG